MSETEIPSAATKTAPSSLLSSVCYALGGAGLLLAMTADFLGVVGRHVGVSVVGVIEVVQYCVVVAISAALIVATINKTHAAVHILTERVGPRTRWALERFSELLTAAFLLAVVAGDIWLLSDVWFEDERSDLLGLPIAPARIFWCVGLGIALALTVSAIFRRFTPETRP